jgi:hypothetical protein
MSPLPSRSSTSVGHFQDVFLAQNAHGVLGVEVETHVHLHAANRRQIVALGSKNSDWNIASAVPWSAVRPDASHGRYRTARLRGTRSCRLQRVADVGAGVDMVDVQHGQIVKPRSTSSSSSFAGDFVTCFGVDFTGFMLTMSSARY